MVKVRVRPETGRLYFDVSLLGQRCKELTLLDDSAVNRAKAEALAKKMNEQIERGTFVFSSFFPNSKNVSRFPTAFTQSSSDITDVQIDAPGIVTQRASNTPTYLIPTFSRFAEVWFKEMSPGWRTGTKTWMDSIIRIHLTPTFGTRRIDHIKRADLLGFRASLCEGNAKGHRRKLSTRTINVVMRVLRSILTEAADRYEFKNPGSNMRRLKSARKEIVPFSMEEVQLILKTVRADFRPYLTVAFFTGMRPGEINGLQWKDVDLERQVIHVRQTYLRGRIDTTKTEGSQREIQLSLPVINALREQRAISGQQNTFVFCMPNGAPIYDRNYSQRVWEPLLRHLGLARRVPYQTRHTCATLWLAAGENPGWIARQLGHETTEMLFRVYSRWAPNLLGRDGSAFERVLQQSGISSASPANDPHLDPAAQQRNR